MHGKVGDIANAYMLSFLLQQQAWELLDRRNVALAWTNGVTAGRWLLRIVFTTLAHHREYAVKCSCGGLRHGTALTRSVG